MSEPLRVLIVDDQKLVRSGFAMMLAAETDIEVVGEAADGAVALTQAQALRPDVILMDVQMPGTDGIEATRQIVAADLGKVVILTTFDSDDYVVAGLEAGASGYLLKNTDPDDLAEGIRSVAHGHALLAPEVTKQVIARMAAPRIAEAAPSAAIEELTAREREVLTLVGQGLSNKEIAEHLVLGETTVKTHVSNCLSKLHLRDRVQAVVFAYEQGLVRPGG
ncbi:response regulator [Dermacoccaceae bacterium W4C1]